MAAISAVINGILASKFTDKTRKLKLSLTIFTLISIAGNIMYTFHSSIWFLITERLLCGLCDAAQPLISGILVLYFPAL